MRAVAIIPARGGSVRVPKKNIRQFHGHPIIHYPIEAARASRLFDRIIVSTDDDDIAEVANGAGADVFQRSGPDAHDDIGTQERVRQVLKWLYPITDYACCIYATAAMLRAQYLRVGYERLIASGLDFAFSVTGYDFAPQRALRMGDDGTIEPVQPEHRMTKSQELGPRWHDAGQFYWGRSQAFIDGVTLYSDRSVGIPIPRMHAVDIDTEEDWDHAEKLFSAANS